MLAHGRHRSKQQGRLGKLGCSLLAHDSDGQFGTSGSVLESLLPRLGHVISSVNADAGALGAVYELQMYQDFASRLKTGHQKVPGTCSFACCWGETFGPHTEEELRLS
jgi:hypothetical protein